MLKINVYGTFVSVLPVFCSHHASQTDPTIDIRWSTPASRTPSTRSIPMMGHSMNVSPRNEVLSSTLLRPSPTPFLLDV